MPGTTCGGGLGLEDQAGFRGRFRNQPQAGTFLKCGGGRMDGIFGESCILLTGIVVPGVEILVLIVDTEPLDWRVGERPVQVARRILPPRETLKHA